MNSGQLAVCRSEFEAEAGAIGELAAIDLTPDADPETRGYKNMQTQTMWHLWQKAWAAGQSRQTQAAGGPHGDGQQPD